MHAHTSRYDQALLWAARLHGQQLRKGKPVPYISHLIAVSSMVWEDGGTEDQAIAALLHDAIEDQGQTYASINKRFGPVVARIVADCTDTTGELAPGAPKEPWLVRKGRFISSLGDKSDDSLLVIAADKAHNARDMVIDARKDARSWERFNAGLDGTAWYLLGIHKTINYYMPGSRSNELLGESVKEILASDAYLALVPRGIAPEDWAGDYRGRTPWPQTPWHHPRVAINKPVGRSPAAPKKTMDTAPVIAFINGAIAQLEAAKHPMAYALGLDLKGAGNDPRELLMTRDDAERLLEEI